MQATCFQVIIPLHRDDATVCVEADDAASAISKIAERFPAPPHGVSVSPNVWRAALADAYAIPIRR